jgi:myo-inositol-1(or 4)-monophosphatase
LEKRSAIARQAAFKAGKILKDLFGKADTIAKKGEIDLLTEADIQSEKVILNLIKSHFPGDDILAEEAGESIHGSGYLWIIDPLDGTTNFAHSFPFFAVSIALRAEDEVVAGLVFNPYYNELYEAQRGKGAFLNGNPIMVSGVRDLRESLLATGFPYSIYKDPRRVMDLFERMVVKAQGIRRPGSAALDLCYVASGRMDGFWEEGLQPWDTAAGSLIVEEAGGRVGDYTGAAYSPFQKSIVASNPHIFEKMLDIIQM